MTLVEFLTARLDEDEAVANHAHWAMQGAWLTTAEDKVDEFVRRNSPARVLREVAAKRAILRDHGDTHVCEDGMVFAEDEHRPDSLDRWAPCSVMSIVASVYSDHPDYHDEWR